MEIVGRREQAILEELSAAFPARRITVECKCGKMQFILASREKKGTVNGEVGKS